MLLRRHYDAADLARHRAEYLARAADALAAGKTVDEARSLAERAVPPPRIAQLEVKHTGTDARQNFSERFVAAGRAAGWLTLDAVTDGWRLTLRAQPEDLVYRVLRQPGWYCCHCGKALPDGYAAAAHVALEHAGAASPDPNNPHGYRKLNGYECELAAEQHARYQAAPGALAPSMTHTGG